MSPTESIKEKKYKAIVGLGGSMVMPGLIFYFAFGMDRVQPMDDFQFWLVTYMAVACAVIVIGIVCILARLKWPALIFGTIGGLMCITMFPLGTFLGIIAIASLHDREFKQQYFAKRPAPAESDQTDA